MKKKSANLPADDRVYRVFLSHATYDKWIAEVIHEKIEAAIPRVKVWRDDRDIRGGDRIPDEIRESLRDCDEVLVLVTPESWKRIWIQVEVGAAWGLGKRLVPVFYHVDPGEMFNILKERRGYHLHEFAGYLEDLKSRAAGRVPHG